LSRHPIRRSTARRLLPPVGLLLALSACRFGAPPGATDQGRDIAGLYHLMFWIAIGVGSITLGLILFSVVKFRRKNEELPKQTRYHVPLEITYTVIPILIVLFIFVATWRVERRVDHIDANPAVTVDATAFQWQWRFSYPQYGIDVIGTPTREPTFVVPVGEPVRIELRAQDVIHAFFVPRFLFKRDAIPGKLNEFDITIPRAGRFFGECAEFCGLNHSDMGFSVRAVPRDQFDSWVRQQQAAASPTPSASPSPSVPTGVTPTPIASQAG
jgi:cytochrome c oxidase subunit 2